MSQKSVFLFRFNAPVLVRAASHIASEGVSVKFWSGRKQHVEAAKHTNQFSETIFHNTIDSVRGVPPKGIDTNRFLPADDKFIRDMFECESQALVMMNSIDLLERVGVAERKRLYYEQLRFWRGIYDLLKPDALFFGDIPHIADQYIAYSVGKYMGIPTVLYADPKRMPDRLLFFKDFRRYDELKSAYDEAIKQEISLEYLPNDLKEYYEKHRNPSFDASPPFRKPEFVRGIKKQYQIVPSLRQVSYHLKKLSIVGVGKNYISALRRERTIPDLKGLHFSLLKQKMMARAWRKQKKEFERECRSLITVANYNEPFIYVPLHNQPERSTSAEGGIFVDQILMVEMLASALPERWKIYVKETPLQWLWPRTHVGRYAGYYQRLAKIPSVQLVSPEMSTFELIRNCRVVASVTGTAGWEGILRDKPALVFGYNWYMHAHGAFNVKTNEDCKNVLNAIEHGFAVDQKKVIAFLAAIDKVAIHGHDLHKFNAVSEISPEENAKRIAEGFISNMN